MEGKEIYLASDIVNPNVSTFIEKLKYPNFKFWASNKINVFVLFMDDYKKIYYCKRNLNEQYLLNVKQIGKQCQSYNKFHPEKIDFGQIANRFKRDPEQKFRKNADLRLGFHYKNQYLVKAYFTLGLRTVKKDTAHVIQTLNVPLIIYVLPKMIVKRYRPNDAFLTDRMFHYDKIHLFDRYVLLQNSVYRIPNGTVYMLFSLQKNFFSINIVDDNYNIPFPYENPIKQKISKLPKKYDVPPMTPFIGDYEIPASPSPPPPPPPPQSDDGPSKKKLKKATQEEMNDFAEFFTENPFFNNNKSPNEEDSFKISETEQSENNNTSLQQQQQQQQQQHAITYFIIPPQPSILEKNIVLADLDFVKNYQFLNEKMRTGPRYLIPEWIEHNPDDDLEPVDLSFRSPSPSENLEENVDENSEENLNISLQKKDEYSTANIQNDSLEEEANDSITSSLNENSIINNDNLINMDDFDNFLEQPMKEADSTTIDNVILELFTPLL